MTNCKIILGKIKSIINIKTIAASYVLIMVLILLDMKYDFRININKSVIFLPVFFCVIPLYALCSLSDRVMAATKYTSYSAYVIFLVHMMIYQEIIDVLFKNGLIKISISGESYFKNPDRLAYMGILIFLAIAILSGSIQKAYDILIMKLLPPKGKR